MTAPASAPAAGTVQLVVRGRIAYEQAQHEQRTLREAILAGTAGERFLLCEHDPVLTLGRSAQAAHVLASREALAARGVAICASERGGDVTYHGPGQLVGYPVVRLRRGVLHHVESLAHAIVEVVAALGISAEWRRDCPGVWVGRDKVAAFGIHVHRGVAIHGFSLNLRVPPEPYAWIVPCGVRTGGVTSLDRLLPELPELYAVGREIASCWARRAGVALCEAEGQPLA